MKTTFGTPKSNVPQSVKRCIKEVFRPNDVKDYGERHTQSEDTSFDYTEAGGYTTYRKDRNPITELIDPHPCSAVDLSIRHNETIQTTAIKMPYRIWNMLWNVWSRYFIFFKRG